MNHDQRRFKFSKRNIFSIKNYLNHRIPNLVPFHIRTISDEDTLCFLIIQLQPLLFTNVTIFLIVENMNMLKWMVHSHIDIHILSHHASSTVSLNYWGISHLPSLCSTFVQSLLLPHTSFVWYSLPCTSFAWILLSFCASLACLSNF